MRRKTELECPRCRLIASQPPARQGCCPRCGAELVLAHGPSEESVRAHLYGPGRGGENCVAVPSARR